MARLVTHTITYDLPTATGTGASATAANALYKDYLEPGSTVVAVYAKLNGASQGPCAVSGMFVFDQTLGAGYYFPGTNGTLRSDANYTSADMVEWTGSLLLPNQSPYLFAAVRNDTGSTVQVQIAASVVIP